jgi:gamma-glutamyltranspeptidase/glutathione hydrolase
MAGCVARSAPPDGFLRTSPNFVEARNGVVVSSSGPASEVGVDILRQGGNAVDAAIATAFALAVTYPPAGNIGGGGFMLVHPAPGEGHPTVIDYRETAPGKAWKTMVTREESQFTARAVAVPGTLRGMEMAHRRFGSLPWATLLGPAIRLAREGFPLSEHLTEKLNEVLSGFREFGELQRVFGKPGGGAWKPGDRLLQPDLARTLLILAEEGPDAFYTGAIAQAIVAELDRGSGLLTAEDLARYRALERQPLHARYRDRYDVYAPPSPSSGGPCLIEELNILDAFDLGSWGRWDPRTLHVMAESMRRAACDRARYLGDPAFVDIPDRLASPGYGRGLAKEMDVSRATPSASLSAQIALSPEGNNTTHFSIIDRKGMGVANTYTLERLWGSRIVVRGMGFLLNNDMRAFNLFPGVTDRKGTVGTDPNTIAPGKRPLSSQSPTIVAEGGRVLLVTGTPGSRSIPNTILCVLVNLLDFGMPLDEAIQAPRLSHEWFPDRISWEAPEAKPEAIEALRRMGHLVERMDPLAAGSAHTIRVLGPGRYQGMGDLRRGGEASGY